MKVLRTWLSRLAGMFLSGRQERDLSDEIASHLQMHIDDSVAPVCRLNSRVATRF